MKICGESMCNIVECVEVKKPQYFICGNMINNDKYDINSMVRMYNNLRSRLACNLFVQHNVCSIFIRFNSEE